MAVLVLALVPLALAVVVGVVGALERGDVTLGYVVGGIVVIAIFAGVAAGIGAFIAWITSRRS